MSKQEAREKNGFYVFFKKKKKSITSTEGSLLFSSSEIQIWQPSTCKYVVLKSSEVSILNGYRVLNKEKNYLVKDTADRYIWNNNKDNHQLVSTASYSNPECLSQVTVHSPSRHLPKQRYILSRGWKKINIFLIQSYPQTNNHWQYTA